MPLLNRFKNPLASLFSTNDPLDEHFEDMESYLQTEYVRLKALRFCLAWLLFFILAIVFVNTGMTTLQMIFSPVQSYESYMIEQQATPISNRVDDYYNTIESCVNKCTHGEGGWASVEPSNVCINGCATIPIPVGLTKSPVKLLPPPKPEPNYLDDPLDMGHPVSDPS